MNTRLYSRIGGVLLSLLAGWCAVVLDPMALPAWSAQDGCVRPTPAALAGFFDEAVPARLKADHVPGAVLSVVKGPDEVFAKGYGQAGAGVPFDPSRSLVRIASTTKLFTWTAVMQQVEAGRLDLDADVNRYLKGFRIPATYPDPVTMLDLMNHTAGFEDRVIGTGARAAGDVPPLGEYLARHMPARIRPPGEVSAYSNYGAALAGHIVAQVSGEPYEAYVQRHLLTPLAMTHSTAREPVPAPLAGGLARSYDSDTREEIPFTFDAMPPEGAISATADDMAHFMIAHLRDGRFRDTSVLSPASAKRMHQRSFSADPRLPGYAHGFKERAFNGHRALMHDGSWEGFLNALILVPDCDLGVFVSTNGTAGVETITELTRAFFDRFTPGSSNAPASGVTSAAPKAGFYKPARHNESTVEKVLTLLAPARLSLDGDGTVHFKGKEWSPRGNGLYAQADGSDHLAFRTGADGQLYLPTDGPTYQRMTTLEHPLVNYSILLGFLLTALTALAVPLSALRRRRHRSSTTTTPWRRARALAATATLLGVAFLTVLAVQLFGDTGDTLYGMPARIDMTLAMPIVMLTTAGAAAVCTLRNWRGSGATLTARVHQLAMFLGLAALTVFLWQWNLLGWQY
jgi:CubicO group peptidase (beta-lactamase class C family)